MPNAFLAGAVKAETEAVKKEAAVMNFIVISTSEIYEECGKDTVFSNKTDT
jgi:dTDP-D-glucose 4,6-dehydratase